MKRRHPSSPVEPPAPRGEQPLTCRLRPWAAGDLRLLQALLGDAQMMRHLGGPESPEAVRARHGRYLTADPEKNGLFAVTVGLREQAAGWVGFWEAEWRGETVWEGGWSVLPWAQGRGVGTAAAALMIEEARDRHRHRHLHAFPRVANEASNALCRRLGFELLGAVEIEYPKGVLMQSNDWRFDLVPPPGETRGAWAVDPSPEFAPSSPGKEKAVRTTSGPGEIVMSDQDFTITREFDAPRELVFKAWTDCEFFSQWWGPTEFTTSHCSIDPRPGGNWISAMRSPEGHDFWSSGTFVEIDAPSRFVVDEGFSDESGRRVSAREYGMTDDMPDEDRITVTLEEREGRTRLTMRQGIPTDVAVRNGAPDGWSQSFDKLDAYLRELQRGRRTAH